MAILSSRFVFFFGLLLNALILLDFPIVCHAQTLFVFGDGLYDAGNKQYLTKEPVPANSLPYGVSVGKSTGRWSDGNIVPDYIAKFMGIPQISPILNTDENFIHGASFAVADATVLPGAPSSTMSLAQQMVKFTENKNKWTEEERSKAIYLFYIGGEDYTKYTKSKPNPSQEEKRAFVNQIIDSVEETLKTLYAEGGRKFAFQNLAPLGCLPAVKQENGRGEECVILPSEMAALHNRKLSQVLGKLSRTLHGFQFTVYDYFSSVHKRVISPKNYQFQGGKRAACGAAIVCTASTVHKHPEDHFFFDGKYLTQEANNQIAHLLWGGGSNIVNPSNLRELLELPLDLPFEYSTIYKEPSASNDVMSQVHLAYDVGSLDREAGNPFSYVMEGIDSLII